MLRNITERLRLLVQECKSMKLRLSSFCVCVSTTKRMSLSVEILANIERECYHCVRRYFKLYVIGFQPVTLRAKNHEQSAFYDTE